MSERGDSNARPLRPERSALPTALLSDFGSAKVGTFCEISKRKPKKLLLYDFTRPSVGACLVVFSVEPIVV